MTSFFELPLEINAEALVEAAYADMVEAFPDWEPAPGNPETWLIRAIAYRLIVPLAQAAVDVGGEIFHEFGRQIVNLPPIDATPASVSSTWTMVDDQGYTVLEGMQVDVAIAGDDAVAFRVLGDVVVAPGDTATADGEVVLEAIDPGTAGNDLSGTATLVDAFDFVETIALVGSSTGGTDAEDPATYLNRLAATMQTLGPHPILPRDVEIVARNVAGVSRATALDLFNPDTDDPDDTATWDSERHCSVAVVDAEGAPCSSPVKAAVLASLQAKREVNFVFHVLDATYTSIDVEFEVVILPGFDQATVDAAVVSAITHFLDPAIWGTSAPEPDPTAWRNVTTLYYQDLVTLVNETQGVDRYTTLDVGETGGGLSTVDVVLDGPAALPEVGTISVVTS